MNQLLEALVLVSYGAHGVVQVADGRRMECKFRRQVGRPCCGDHVLVRRVDPESCVVDKILARTNEFARADRRGRKHVVAANLDRVLIVIAPRPPPSRDLLDRYLVAVHSLEIDPVIVLNKADLLEAGESAGHETLERLNAYVELGYPVVKTSCRTEPGTSMLQPVLGAGTSILVGQSGVGKSSLIRQLIPALEILIGELSRVTGKGTHTTTTTILYDLPEGGRLIDSPGVWEYGLWDMKAREIARGFREFLPFVESCHFQDCLHVAEPDCAVKAAVERGEIYQWRYRSYLRLLEQNCDARTS